MNKKNDNQRQRPSQQRKSEAQWRDEAFRTHDDNVRSQYSGRGSEPEVEKYKTTDGPDDIAYRSNTGFGSDRAFRARGTQSLNQTPSPFRGEDYGESRYSHHDYNRGSMSDTEPYNEYGAHDENDYGTESRQSLGRGYGADTRYGRGYGSQQIYGPAPTDHTYSQNPGPQAQRDEVAPPWSQSTGRWQANGDMHGSSSNHGTHAKMYDTRIPAGKGPKGYKRSDERIYEDIGEALESQAGIDASDVEVRVSEGEVTLTGTVTSRRMKRAIEDVVDNCRGVKDVRNEIRVQADSDQNAKNDSSSSARNEGNQQSRSARPGPNQSKGSNPSALTQKHTQ